MIWAFAALFVLLWVVGNFYDEPPAEPSRYTLLAVVSGLCAILCFCTGIVRALAHLLRA